MFWIAAAMFAVAWTGSFGLPMKFTTKWKWENTWAGQIPCKTTKRKRVERPTFNVQHSTSNKEG